MHVCHSKSRRLPAERVATPNMRTSADRGHPKRPLQRMFFVCGLVTASCQVGDARDIDTRQHLSGLDLHYLQQAAKSTSTENAESIEGQMTGLPFGFAPLGLLRYDISNSLHRGEVTLEEETATAAISGYEHRSGGAVALGAAIYNIQEGTWGIDGELVQWCGSYGVGWGLIFDYEHGGDAPGVETRRSARFLRGLIGYTGDANQSTLHLLWLPIPIW